jgi:diacylglycerol kinase family enzyme
MYLVAAIRSIINHYETTTIKFNIDGKESTRGLLMFTVGNGHREGGGFQVTPSAKNNDGIFDYLMLDPISRPMMFRVLPEVMAGTHERHSFVETSTFKKMNFEADRAMPIHLDGEVWAPYEANIRKISVEIIPSAVRLVR